MNALLTVNNRLKELNEKYDNTKNYRIPSVWLNLDLNKTDKYFIVNPYQFYFNRIQRILKLSSLRTIPPSVDNHADIAIVYNMLIRHATAFDHDSDGQIRFELTKERFRETGTFLKTIALLPYIHSLGVNTIHLLPITSIGKQNKKGSLGSPYAIRHPYKLDENLSEPILELDINTQFLAFVEAAHLLGIKIILEFVFRTASIDSDCALDHPEWFYWIKEEIKDRPQFSKDNTLYGPPIFSEQELSNIKNKINNYDFDDLPEPDATYKNMFTDTPIRTELRNGAVIGFSEDDEICKIPHAFADWPPDDIQPVWNDVTYLKLYDNQEFNYISYNTIRMYDNKLKLNGKKIEELWVSIANIIPYFQNKFDIDGVMIDMGHALPAELLANIINQARINNPKFIFWEENFVISKQSIENGFNAITGYMAFDAHIPYKLKNIIRVFQNQEAYIPFFGTAETHNTQRAAARNGNTGFSKIIWLITCFLPTIPFIQAGFELGETMPVNTGLEFSQEDIIKYPAQSLALFSEAALCWETDSHILEFILKINKIKNDFFPIRQSKSNSKVVLLDTNNESCIAFYRFFNINNNALIIICNLSENIIQEALYIDMLNSNIIDLIENKKYCIVNNILEIELSPYQTLLLKQID